MPFFQTEGRHSAEFIVSEASHYRSRDVVTVEEGADLDPATVVATATGSTVRALALDGLDIPYGVLMHPARAADGPARVTALVRDCEVSAASLAWPAGATDAQKADIIAGLADRGIIVR